MACPGEVEVSFENSPKDASDDEVLTTKTENFVNRRGGSHSAKMACCGWPVSVSCCLTRRLCLTVGGRWEKAGGVTMIPSRAGGGGDEMSSSSSK